MIATIAKRFTFDAAHRLDRLPPEHKCHRMHGHTYEVEFVLSGMVDANGFVVDYAAIADLWAPLHEMLDHRVLNDVPGLEVPSTENLAAWICVRFGEALRRLQSQPHGPGLDRVVVRESSSTWSEVRPHNMSLFERELLMPRAKSPRIFGFKITGEGGGEYTVDCTTTQPLYVHGLRSTVGCTVEISAEDLRAMRDDPQIGMQFYFQGRLRVSGDPMMAMDMRALYALASPLVPDRVDTK